MKWSKFVIFPMLGALGYGIGLGGSWLMPAWILGLVLGFVGCAMLYVLHRHFPVYRKREESEWDSFPTIPLAMFLAIGGVMSGVFMMTHELRDAVLAMFIAVALPLLSIVVDALLVVWLPRFLSRHGL